MSAQEQLEVHEQNVVMQIPALNIPGFLQDLARERGTQNNVLMSTFGGLGDHVCAESTIRFAIEKWAPGIEVSLISDHPELFRHLKFKKILSQSRMTRQELQELTGEYMIFNTAVPPSDFSAQFINHNVTNCLDFPAIKAFRMQLPVQDRPIRLEPDATAFHVVDSYHLELKKCVAIHPGRHWPSKTFPAKWWDAIAQTVGEAGYVPLWIGADRPGEMQGTVNVTFRGPMAVDLRNKLSIMETVALIKQVPVVLTNDSSPLHLAADSQAWIGFLATCKSPDNITHWRINGGKAEWSWRMENLSLGGLWDQYRPNCTGLNRLDFATPEQVRSWLPKPEVVAAWAISKVQSTHGV